MRVTNNNLKLGIEYPGDRYGYYEIGNNKTYSCYELMDIYHEQPLSYRWNYNDNFFKKQIWNKEPNKTINELYHERAKQLRKKYDYLILYYSSGYDSGNMLHAFLDNNIHIDEICVWNSKHDFVSDQYEEFNVFTKKKLERISKNHPNIKVRILEFGDNFINWDYRLRELGYHGRLIDAFGKMLTVNRLVTDTMHDTINDWKEIIKNGKQLAWVHGNDKPRLRFYKNKWIFNFHDALIHHSITPFRQYIDTGNIGHYEFFYWSPCNESAQIIIKQCHLIKKKYDSLAKKDFDLIPGAKPFVEGYGYQIDTMNQEFVKIIYPRLFEEDEVFFTKKAKGPIFGNRDQWFFNSDFPGSERHWQLYLSFFKEDRQHYNPWYNDGKSIDSGIKHFLSLDYII